MSVTFDVSKDERSRDASDEQLENMQLMSVTFDVSKDERSRDVNDLQP